MGLRRLHPPCAAWCRGARIDDALIRSLGSFRPPGSTSWCARLQREPADLVRAPLSESGLEVDIALALLVEEESAEQPASAADRCPQPGVAGHRADRRTAGRPQGAAAQRPRSRGFATGRHGQARGYDQSQWQEFHDGHPSHPLHGHFEARPRRAPIRAESVMNLRSCWWLAAQLTKAWMPWSRVTPCG